MIGDLVSLMGVRHPSYKLFNEDWLKWRLTMAGGRVFLHQYLKQFTEREETADFLFRRSLSYCSGYAKSAIREIINSVFQRMRDITRVGGPESYITAVDGRSGGVNLEGMSMNMFIGQKILPELLSMGRVGIYVDMPQAVAGATMADTYGLRPYLYFYRVEDILNWNYSDMNLQTITLRDTVYTYDKKYGVPNGTACRYRYINQTQDGKIYVRTYTEGQDQQGDPYATDPQEYQLGLKRIPFIMVDIGESLLTDVADHQIALTNIESSDIAYILNANFPTYTEQQNQHIAPTHTKKVGDHPGSITTGPKSGRQYPMGAERPGWIAPSPDPLRVSIEKQDQIRNEIRHLVHLAVSNLVVNRASADSKAFDNGGLEAGLAFIGLTLEYVENYVAERWCEYVGEANIPTVKYPSQYSLLSDTERRAAAKDLLGMKDDLPSTLARKEIIKLASRTLFDGRVSPAVMDDIYAAIDKSRYVSGRPQDIEHDKKEGLVSAETASEARGYAPGESKKAQDEFFQRLKLITETQAQGIGPNAVSATNRDAMNTDVATIRDTAKNNPGNLTNPAARGVPDLSPTPAASASQEKK